MKLDLAPIARHFISVEGESTRVGQLTGFVVMGDGHMRSVSEVLDKFLGDAGVSEDAGPELKDLMCAIVLNVCEVTYFDWMRFATIFIGQVAQEGVPLILETRGERKIDRLGAMRLYLHLTPGCTLLTPAELRDGDELKMLVHQPADVAVALAALKPFADTGFPCFIMPRVAVKKLKPIYEEFMQHEPGDIRMMLVEHEVVGIE